MPLDFPNTPALNQAFTDGALVWVWDGLKWVGRGSGIVPSGHNPIPLLVGTTTTLPAGFAGVVRVENQVSAPITITLPAAPVAGQEITIKDSAGNTSTYPATIAGNGGALIEGAPSITLNYDFSWVDLYFTGVQWVQV